MITVAWVRVPGSIELNFLWDSERCPIVCIRGEELSWQEYVQAFGSAGAVQYEMLAWENRIAWVPDKPMIWHKQQTGVYEVTDRDLCKEMFGNEQ